MWGWLSNLVGGIGKLFSGSGGGGGNVPVSSLAGGQGSGFGSFSGYGQGPLTSANVGLSHGGAGAMYNVGNYGNVAGMIGKSAAPAMTQGASTAGGGWGSALGQLFGQKSGEQFNPMNALGSSGAKLLGGLGLMGASQLIGNPKPPSMPESYNQFMSQMQQGGTPGMQAANNYYMGVLSGNNKDAYDAAYHSLDLNYEEQLRQLNSMYKSLRPGTDPTTDSTYQRDLANLNDQYSRARAQVGAQVQQGAAQGAAGLGTQQMSGTMAGVQAQLDNIAQQWGMNYAQKEALRNQILGMGSSVMSSALDPYAGIYQKMFSRMFGG